MALRLFNKKLPKTLKQCAKYSTSANLPSYVVNVPQTKVTTLENGIRVATEENFSETASVGAWINTGSAQETAENNGVAHFLEHMIFKGTAKRSRTDIELEVENMGAKLNAYTSREQTVFYANCFKDSVPQTVDILSDIVQNSNIEEQHVEKERGVILREMEEINKNMEEVVFDHLHSIAYQDTPLGMTILGPEENIKSITRDQLKSWIDTHYTGQRMVIAGAGAVNHEQLVQQVADKFGSIPKENKIDMYQKEETPFTGSMVTVRNDDIPLQHVVLAARSVSWSHPDYFVFLLLQTIIGNWDRSLGGSNNMVSQLAEKVATNKWAHSLMTFNTTYKDTGLFGNYMVTHPGDHTTELCFNVLKEWVRLSVRPTEKDLLRAKNKLKSSIFLQLDGTFATAEDIGRQMLNLGRRMTPAEMFIRIDAITTDDLKRVGRQYLYDVDIAAVAVGSVQSFPDYNELRGWTYDYFI